MFYKILLKELFDFFASYRPSGILGLGALFTCYLGKGGSFLIR